ncbi:hypothetical protein LCGC14_0388390 [marine sediment metagenome]|uniref:Uncharacterized protein n=1 Tax=marine sediment metagenome TaxID=412755 RepID=A0A0F9TIB3_9ZZZZ
MADKNGNKTGGRQSGSKNKVGKAFKDLLTETYQALEDDPKHGLKKFAEEHPSDFYRICSKLVPQEMAAELTGELTIRVVRD